MSICENSKVTLHPRHQAIRHGGVNLDRFSILVKRRSYIEDVQKGGGVDEECSFRIMASGTDPSPVTEHKCGRVAHRRVEFPILQEVFRTVRVRVWIDFGIVHARPAMWVQSKFGSFEHMQLEEAHHVLGTRIVPAGMK